MVTLGDLTALIDVLFITLEPPDCPEEADLDHDLTVGLGDLTYLIDHLYGDGTPLPPCP